MAPSQGEGLRSRHWEDSYRTSAIRPDHKAVDILHDFYIPVLSRSVRYDRVAGYFSSSSLAAASQGFSAFVKRRGRIRLIVGAKLSAQDAQAILEGNQDRYAARLRDELGERESWPEDVTRGVELLAWMVAHDYLDVRIAIRVHRATRDPLPFLSNVDGYMHEKWAIFEDEDGHRLLATGSLNESQLALIHNAENLEVHCDWWGDREIRRIHRHQEDFNFLWRDRHPHFRVLTLPEAVREQLVDLGRAVPQPREIDGSSAAPRDVSPPSPDELLRFALIREGPKLPGGRYVGMETAPVEPWPHQAIVARRLIETWPYSFLLCDEVGLGKTIESGLAIRSLYLSGFAQRILVAPPASLKEQWQREMKSKFLLPFAVTETSPRMRHIYIHPFEQERTSSSPFDPNLNIVSSAVLQRRDWRAEVAAAEPFDIVLIDEAHACRRRNPTAGLDAEPDYGLLYRTIHDVLRAKSGSLWLATATPMQLEKIEAWDLLRLISRTGAFQLDPRLTFAYYDALAEIVSGNTPREFEWGFLRRALSSIESYDYLHWEYLQRLVIDARLRQPTAKWLENDILPRGGDEKRMARLIFAGSPLARVMLRHTRGLLEIYKKQGQLKQKLASRQILPLPVLTFSEAEEAACQSLETYCEELSRQVNRHSDRQQKYNVGFYKSFLRLRFASSFYAIQETVRRRRIKVAETIQFLRRNEAQPTEPDQEQIEAIAMDPEEEEGRELEEAVLKNRSVEDLTWEAEQLEELHELLLKLTGPSTKTRELLAALDKRRDPSTGRFQQTVVFTRFYDTLRDIVRHLREADRSMLIGTYSGQGGEYTDRTSGQLIPVDREHVKHMFLKGDIDILVCTDAAAEGLNLQTANLIINFDLPWNPMKVEQRIGRLDRIGQKHDEVYVLNLCYVGSTEEIVYGRLLRRLQDAQLIVGAQQFSMLPVTHEEFRDLADHRLTEDQLQKIAEKRAIEQRERSRTMEIPAQDLYEIYGRLERSPASPPTPVTLSAIWEAISGSEHLRQLGCKLEERAEEQVMTMSGIEGIPERAYLTVSRQLYDEGLPESGLTPNFAAYGDFVFDHLLDYYASFELPPRIQRLSVEDPETGLETVGFLVASDEAGGTAARLVCAWHDLEGIQLESDRELTQAELDQAKAELAVKAGEELRIPRAVAEIERLNLRAAKAQLIFSYLLADRLLSRFAGNGDGQANFWSLVDEMEGQLGASEGASVTGLPPDKLRTISSELLFTPKIPRTGGAASIVASPILLGSAIGAARRQADSLKKRKAQLLVDEVIARLERQIELELEEFAKL